MSRIPSRLVLITGFATMVGGCSTLSSGVHEANIAMDHDKYHFRSHLAHMADNALLHDMSLADIHFTPHSDELSSTGTARLARLAKLLNVYGGIVRYETYLADDTLIANRIEHVREYLTFLGCDQESLNIQVMMSGGRSTPGDQALSAHQRNVLQTNHGGTTASSAGTGILGGSMNSSR